MQRSVSSTPSALLAEGSEFREQLRALRSSTTLPDFGWYPYDSLSSLEMILSVLEPCIDEISEALSTGPIADIGCADGDLAFLLARHGVPVDAIDHSDTNFNQMRGAKAIRERSGLNVGIYDLDLDGRFDLPRPCYRFAFLLGTLYHLKNPFYVLEQLAAQADWCLLSTRIAQATPAGAAIEDEALAYLLDSREANGDPTNYWIFSGSGLRRLVRRAGWIDVVARRVGATAASNPVDANADERIFMLLKSRRLEPDVRITATEGWRWPAVGGRCETSPRFVLGIEVLKQRTLAEFALRIRVPQALVSAGPVRIECKIGEQLGGTLTCSSAEIIEFRGRFPSEIRGPVRVEFRVEYAHGGSAPETGPEIPLIRPTPGNENGIPLRLS